MRLRTIVAVGLAALLVTTGTVAALPGNASADAGPGDTKSVDDGPPATLPGPVPAFLSDIHDAIDRFLGGGLVAPLGETVGETASGDGR